MKALLFPFDLVRWVTLGFCSWVLLLGEQQNSGNMLNVSDLKDTGEFDLLDSLHLLFWGEAALTERIAAVFGVSAEVVRWVLFGGSFLLAAGIVLWIVIAYFQARMTFVWLDDLLCRRALIREPYIRYKEQGGRYFKGKLLVDIAYWCVLLGAVAISLVPFVQYLKESARLGEWGGFDCGLAVGIGVVLVFVILYILFGIYYGLLFAFLPLIMYKKNCSFRTALREFNGLLNTRWTQFLKYILFLLLIHTAAGFLISGLICCSCCLLALPLCLPVIGAVLLLPWNVFRSYFAIEFFETLTAEPSGGEEASSGAPAEEVVVAEIVEPGI